MSVVTGILLLVGLFLLFPLVKRERRGGGCGTGGCWKKQLGLGCAACPIEDGPGPAEPNNSERPGRKKPVRGS